MQNIRSDSITWVRQYVFNSWDDIKQQYFAVDQMTDAYALRGVLQYEMLVKTTDGMALRIGQDTTNTEDYINIGFLIEKILS